MSSVSEENAHDGAKDMDLDFEEGVNETVFGDPEIARGGTPTPPVSKGKKARKAAVPRVKKAAPAKEGKRPKSKKAALALLDSVADQLIAQDAQQKEQAESDESAQAVSSEAVATAEDTTKEPESTPKKVDRRRGKITDPVKLAARREQLNKMREKALAARSANAKRARELKEAAAWKKKQDEEALLSAFNNHISGLSEPQVDTQTKKYSRAVAIKRHKAAAAVAEKAEEAEEETETLPTPPSLPTQASAAAASKVSAAEKRVEPSPFGGYYAAPTGWNVNPTGKPVSRFARNPNVYF